MTSLFNAVTQEREKPRLPRRVPKLLLGTARRDAAGKRHVGNKPLLPTSSKSQERREHAATGFKNRRPSDTPSTIIRQSMTLCVTSVFNKNKSTKVPTLGILWLPCLAAMLTGCAGFYGAQTPAPVFHGDAAAANTIPEPIYPAPGTVPPAAPKRTGAAVEIRPLPGSPAIEAIAIKPEPIQPEPTEDSLLTPEQEHDLAEFERRQQQANQAPTASPEAMPPPVSAPEVALSPEPPAAPPPFFEPLQRFAPFSPVVTTLVLAANKSTNAGNIESATASIERAIRIEPRNATLYYKLALLRLEQNKPRLAEDLAKKSALLASTDKTLKKHSWLLIAKARDIQNNPQGAQQARVQANQY